MMCETCRISGPILGELPKGIMAIASQLCYTCNDDSSKQRRCLNYTDKNLALDINCMQ